MSFSNQDVRKAYSQMNLKNLAIIASIAIPLDGLIIWGIVCLWRFIASF